MKTLSGAIMLVASGLFALASVIASSPGSGIAGLMSLVIGVSGFCFLYEGGRDGNGPTKLE
jgi:hypothetical protein